MVTVFQTNCLQATYPFLSVYPWVAIVLPGTRSTGTAHGTPDRVYRRTVFTCFRRNEQLSYVHGGPSGLRLVRGRPNFCSCLCFSVGLYGSSGRARGVSNSPVFLEWAGIDTTLRAFLSYFVVSIAHGSREDSSSDKDPATYGQSRVTYIIPSSIDPQLSGVQLASTDPVRVTSP